MQKPGLDWQIVYLDRAEGYGFSIDEDVAELCNEVVDVMSWTRNSVPRKYCAVVHWCL